MSGPSDNEVPTPLPARIAGWFAALSCARPRLMLWLVLSLACASVGYSVTSLKITTGHSGLTPQESRFARNWEQYSDAFGADSDVLVVIESSAPNRNLLRTLIDDVGSKLKREPQYFRDVLASVDLSAMRRKALQFLTQREVQRTASLLKTYDRVVRDQNWSLIRAEKIAGTLGDQIEQARQNGVVPDATWISTERFSASLANYLRNARQTGSPERNAFQSPLPDLMSVAGDQRLTDEPESRVLNAEGTIGVVQVGLADGDPDAAMLRLRQILAEVRTANADHPDVRLSLTGLPALEADELRTASIDMKNAGLLALVIVGTLLLLVFRGMRYPMLVLTTLLISLCWTFAAATLVVGHLNLVSVCFTVFLIGLSVDFSVSLIHRYLALRQELQEIPEAVQNAVRSTGGSIITSALTAALAFSTALLTGFPGLAELGLISALGALLSAAAAFIFLPALIAISDAEVDLESLPVPFSPAPLRKLLVAWPAPTAAAAAVLVLIFASLAFRYSDGQLKSRVSYNPNLMQLQDPQAESVRAERQLSEAGTDTVLHAVALADSWEQAVQLREKFLRLETVARVSDAASKLPEPPAPQTVQLLRSLQQQAASISGNTPSLDPADHMAVGREVDRLYSLVRTSTNPQAQKAAANLDQFLTDLSGTPGRQARAILGAWNAMVARWLLMEYAEIAAADRFDPVYLRDLPSEFKSRYLRIRTDETQQWALRIYPRGNVWDGAALQKFVTDLRTVDASVTGLPVQILESAGRMSTTWGSIGLYSIAVISVVLLFRNLRPGQKLLTIAPPLAVAAFIGYTLQQRNGAVNLPLLVGIALSLVVLIAAVLDYRNLRDTLMMLLPAFGGGLLLLGVMATAGLELNPLNLIALPLVFAIGIDNGIYLVADCRRQIAEGREQYEMSPETFSSVLVTSLTSIAGFGSLLIAAHQGIFSMGLLLSLGVASCLMVAVLLMPSLLTLVARHQPASMDPVRIIRGDQKTDGAEAASAAREAQKPAAKTKKAA